MSFSLCLNRDETLLLAGFGLLYQTLELDRKGKLIQDSQRLLCSVTSTLERNGAVEASEFKKVMCAMISIDRSSQSGRALEAKGSRRRSDADVKAPKSIAKAPRKPSTIAGSPPVKNVIFSTRRATVPTLLPAALPPLACAKSQRKLPMVLSDSKPDYRTSALTITTDEANQVPDSSLPNLDYLDFRQDRSSVSEPTSAFSTNHIPKAPFDRFVGCGTGGQTQSSIDNMFSPSDLYPSGISPSPAADADWASDLWSIPADNQIPVSGSGLGFSEDEPTSGEELSSCDTNGTYNGITVPQGTPPVGLEDLDSSYAF